MAEKMRYENEKENAKIDDEFNNPEDDLSAEDIYRVYMEEIAASRPAARRRTRSFSARSGTETRRRESASSRAT